MNFNGKNILVVGASSGIGYQLAKGLEASGATVFTASRSKPKDLYAEFVQLDVTDEISEETFSSLPNELHGVVYCPGSINLKPFARLKAEDFLADYRINVLGAVEVIQHTLSRLKQAGSSSVVLFSTVAVQTGMNYHASIAAAKGAIEGLVRSLAAEFAGSSIRFNAIAPSLVDTPLAAKLLSSEEKRAASDKRHPLGRVGKPEELAATAMFLLSDDASWMSGQVLALDGGMSSLKPL
ncbi:SDR family oxidoreductase [Limibacter armeniacum]|uniref:SDR family NAD(P)-dependent oxidoreductase n=1 Tax=Limibacter armeniacum TaxID=466084 RepID=UPI002FE5929C